MPTFAKCSFNTWHQKTVGSDMRGADGIHINGELVDTTQKIAF